MKLTFHPDLIVRTPFFALEKLFETRLDDVLTNTDFREALFIASPDLASQVFDNHAELSQELQLVVWKYFNRMCSRCTPYGIFAGCGKAAWANITSVPRNRNDLRRRTRLDKECFTALVKKLDIEKKLVFKLKLSLNNTLYQIGDQLRMIEPSSGGEDFQIAAFPLSPFMNVLLTEYQNKMFSAWDIIKRGLLLGFTEKAIRAYVLVLFDDGVIKSELDILLPGNELLAHYIETLSGLKQDSFVRKSISLLKQISDQLTLIDQFEIHGFEQYVTLLTFIRSLLPAHPIKKMLQVDFTYSSPNGRINFRLKKKLSQAVEILAQISTSPKRNDDLTAFKRAFVHRYERREIPILVALDPEIGIGYKHKQIIDSFLYNQLSYHGTQKPDNRSVVNNSRHLDLIAAFHATVANQSQELNLEDISLDKLKNLNIKLPTTCSIFFSQISDDQILVKSINGSSGINLFSRFTDFDKDLKYMAAEIAGIDQEHTATVLAEVLHEPFARAGNILPNNDFRGYQVPYLSQAKQDGCVQIPLSDIVVGIDRGLVYLKSKKLNRAIRPMISHAYNYQKSSPLYCFLADLQFQDNENLHFDFPSLVPNQPFYPKLIYDGLVLSPATWFVNWNQVDMDAKGDEVLCVRNFLISKKIPPRFLICEGDNELLIDRGHQGLMLVLVDMFKKRHQLMIKEFLYQDKFSGFFDRENKTYNNELIAILINERKQVSPLGIPPLGLNADLIRNFSFGSEWLYFKIYGGEINADQVLVQTLFPILKNLFSKKRIKEFFFVRYRDPESHLRLRLKLVNSSDLQEITTAFQGCFRRLERSGEVWKIQIDTYSRELERYGNSIEATEGVFCADSYAIIQLLDASRVNENSSLKISLGIRLTADLVQLMTANIDEAIAFCRSMRDNLKEDQGIGYSVEKRLRALFDKDDQLLGYFMRESTDTKIRRVITKRETCIQNQLQILSGHYPVLYEKTRFELLTPYVHMSINRLFSNDQKFYEYIIYNYLFKHYSKLKNTSKDQINFTFSDMAVRDNLFQAIEI